MSQDSEMAEMLTVIASVWEASDERGRGRMLGRFDLVFEREKECAARKFSDSRTKLTDSATPGKDSDAPDNSHLCLAWASDVRAAAGNGEEVFEEAEIAISMPASLLPSGVNWDSAVALRADGDSMEPTIHSGDILVIDHSDREPRDGKVFVLSTDSGLVVKRLRREGAGWRMASDNPEWPSRSVSEDDRILGHAIWFGPERAVSVGG